MRSSVLCLLAPLSLLGCNNAGLPLSAPDGGFVADDLTMPPPDLTVPPPDLVTPFPPPPDLWAPPPDLSIPPSGICAGTRAAGTCFEAFLAPVVACFGASGGCTIQQPMNQMNAKLCYASGAEIVVFAAGGTQQEVVWMPSPNASPCMKGIVSSGAGGGAAVLSLSSAQGQSLTYDTGTGDVTCPDGTHVNVGMDAGGCQATWPVIEPGRSPMCGMGSCP